VEEGEEEEEDGDEEEGEEDVLGVSLGDRGQG